MGLFDRLSRGGAKGRIEDPVQGTARVVAAGGYRGRGIWQSCPMELVIEAPGVPATAVSYKGLAHQDRWPRTGTILSVTVDRADPERFSIDWDALPNRRDVARDSAEQLAAAMRGEAAGAADASAGAGAASGDAAALLGGLGLGGMLSGLSGSQIQVVGDVGSLTEEQKAKLRMLGIDPAALAGAAAAQAASSAPTATPDPSALGLPGAPAAPPAPTAPPADDADEDIARLERLAALHRQGILTDAELAEQKRRILND